MKINMLSKTRLNKGNVFLFIVLVLFVIVSSVSFAVPEQATASPPRFRFVVVGDTHIGPGEDGITRVHSRAIEKIVSEIRPAFVIQVGDFISIDGRATSNSAEQVSAMWENARRGFIDPLLNAGILFFSTPGNHDGKYGKTYGSENSRRIYDQFWSQYAAINRNYPINGNYGQYYSFDYGNAHFVSLAAAGSNFLEDSAAQLAWLTSDLAAAKAAGKSIFTFAHSPLYGSATLNPATHATGKGAMLLQRSQNFMNLLTLNNVRMHFGGHVHVVKEQETGGIRDMIAGMLGGGRLAPLDTRMAAPWTFLVVDFDGRDFQYYKIEWPDFDTSALPASPVVDNPVPASSVPSSLSGIGVCPSGTTPTEDVPGGVAPLLAVRPSGDMSSSSILAAAHRYKGRQYGTGFGQFICVSLVEQVLRDIGVHVTDEMHRKIFVIGGMPENNLVNSDDQMMHGVAGALIGAGIADSVTIDSAQPGDFVQYWWRTGSTWHRNSAIIERAKGNGVFDLYGAHSGDEGVTTKRDVSLADPGMKVFIARLRESSGGTQPVSSSSSSVYSASSSAEVQEVAGSADLADSSAVQPEGPQVTCVPESVLPTTLYDFLINSSMGITTIVGIARQNIAVGINKTPVDLGRGGICLPLSADLDYDIDYLKETYGRNQLEVEAQLQEMQFMDPPGLDVHYANIRVHRMIMPAVRCVERAILACPEGASYDFRTTDSYAWQGLVEEPDLLATSSFGISIDINLDTNPSAQDGELITDIPTCVVDAFRRYGFKWGGDFPEAKSPAHFEFMADPNLIIIQQGITCPGGTELVTLPSDSAEVSSVSEGAAPVSSGAQSLVGNSDFIWPIPEGGNWNNIVSCFGWRNIGGGERYHDGVDVGVGKGTQVVATGDGVVQRACSIPSECLNCNIPQCRKFTAGLCSGGGCGDCDASKCSVCGDSKRQCGGFGNNVLIKHADNLYSHYNHLYSIDPAMSNGAQVTKGQTVGTVGNTGVSQGAHLHFAFYNTPGARNTGDPQRPESGQNPFCFLPDSVLTRLNIQSRNNCVNYGSPPSVSSTNAHLLEDCSFADLSALSGVAPTPAASVASVPSSAEVGGPDLVQVCRPVQEGGTAGAGEGVVAVGSRVCRYCNAGKQLLRDIDPVAYTSCSSRQGVCCDAPCPQGMVVKSNVEFISQCDSAAMGEGGDCWSDGVPPENPSAEPGDRYCNAACGVAVLRMALRSFGIEKSSRDLFCGGPDSVYHPGGSDSALMGPLAKRLGLANSVSNPSIDWNDIVSNIRQGRLIVLSVGDVEGGISQTERYFTTGGHFILLKGASDDYVLSNDPGKRNPVFAENLVLSRQYVERFGKKYVVIG